jgi:hypothetical protein
MPWELILTTLGSSSLTAVIVTVLGLTIAQKFVDQRIANAEQAFKAATELNAQIDIHLREQRIKVYSKIWKESGITPRWPRATNLTYAEILEFSERLRTWYFVDHGGMWLSTEARKAYGKLQEVNTTVIAGHDTGALTVEDYDAILAHCSALRTELTNDLLSRRSAPQ